MNKKIVFTTLSLLAVVLMQFSFAPQNATAATCDWVQFIADITVPDGTVYPAGQSFQKTWRLKNVGTCTWTTNYSLVLASGNAMGAPTSIKLVQSVAPGQTTDLQVTMVAPSTAGTYTGFWKLKNASGATFGIGATANKSFWVEIRVSSSSGGGVGFDFVDKASGAAWTSSAGALTFPGSASEQKGAGLRVDNVKLENGTISGSSGLLMVPQNTFNGYVQAKFEPYRVQFGDHFKSIINCEYAATACYVNFRLDYQIGSGAVNTFWSFNERYEGLYYPADLDVSSLAGQDVQFILRVGAAGYATGDHAVWVAPRIASSSGTAPTRTPTPTITGTLPTRTITPTGGTPTRTPTPNTGCTNRATFVADETIPDGTVFGPNADFTKKWKIKNIGSCTWTTAYRLVFSSGDQMGGPVEVPFTSTIGPNTTVSLSVNLKSPAANGHYTGNWMLKDPAGRVFGIGPSANKPFWVEIVVTGGSLGTLTPTPTSTVTKTSVPGTVTLTPTITQTLAPGATTATPTITATSTVTPTVTLTTPGQSNCTDRASMLADVTVPDGTVFSPSTAFVKTWRIKNVGTCTWTTSYKLVFFSGSQMGAVSSINLSSPIAPNATADLSISMTSPVANGSYRGYWQFQNASNVLFGIGPNANSPFWVDIVVQGNVSTGFDFAASANAANWTSGAGTLGFPGASNDDRGYALLLNTVQLETGATDTRPALLTAPQNVTDGFIQGIFPEYTVQSGDHFQATIGCQFNATNCFVTYRLDYQVGSSPAVTFWTFKEKYDGLTYPVDLNLSALTGQKVKFILTILAAGSPAGDNALWVAPRIQRPGVATAAPTVTPTPTTGVTVTATLTPSPTVTVTVTPTP